MDVTPEVRGAVAPAIDVPAEEIAAITRFHEQGRYLQACERGVPIGPLAQWRGTAARLIAGRIANNVFAPLLARRLHLLAWREDRARAGATYYRAILLMSRRGPPAAWRFLQSLPDFPDATAVERADLLTAKAHTLSPLRDFERASGFLAEAEALNADRPWVWVQKASLLSAQDAYPEALEVARRAHALRPWFRPGFRKPPSSSNSSAATRRRSRCSARGCRTSRAPASLRSSLYCKASSDSTPMRSRRGSVSVSSHR